MFCEYKDKNIACETCKVIYVLVVLAEFKLKHLGY